MARKSDTDITTDELAVAAPDRDWAAEATDTVVNVVATVKSATTDNVQKIVKGIVYGLFALLIGMLVMLWLLVGLFRLVDNYLPPAGSSWSAWLFFGVVFTAIGIFCWVRRGRLIPKPA